LRHFRNKLGIVQVPAAPRRSPFLASRKDLEFIVSLQYEHKSRQVSEIQRVQWRATLAGCSVTVHYL